MAIFEEHITEMQFSYGSAQMWVCFVEVQLFREKLLPHKIREFQKIYFSGLEEIWTFCVS